MEVASPIWKLWTFPFIAGGAEVASVNKKWSGILSEAFTDRDNFQVEFHTQDLPNDQRKVILASWAAIGGPAVTRFATPGRRPGTTGHLF